ncbi:MAG: ABC transporter substrate-binding protein, partial [Acutalibacter sp.]
MKKIATLMAALMLMTAVFAGCGDTSTSSAAGESSTASESSTSSEVSSEASEVSSETSDDASATETGDYGDFTTIEEGKLIMSTNAQFPPYEMVADGEGFNGTGFEGIDVEIASAIADKLGLELQIDDMEFDSALLAVQNNTADVMLAGLSYTEERDEVVDFSTSYATGVQVVIVKEGSDVTMDNLGEKMIGTQRGTTGYIYASDTPENGGFGEDHVQAYDNGATAVQALVNGQIDAVII